MSSLGMTRKLFGDDGAADESQINVLRGAHAWRHLMRTAAGLNSPLPGERDELRDARQLHNRQIAFAVDASSS